MRILMLITGLIMATACLSQSSAINIGTIAREHYYQNNADSSAVWKIVVLRNEATFRTPKKYSNKGTGTIDSERGELACPSLKINYDIGFSAGAHMGDHQKKGCSSYFDTVVSGYRTAIGLKGNKPVKELVITIWGDCRRNAFSFPANFWAFVNSEDEIREMLRIVFSYKPKKV